MQHSTAEKGVPPLLMSVLSTTIGWLIDEEEINREVEAHIEEIRRLNALTDGELAEIGITRDQITAHVLQEPLEL